MGCTAERRHLLPDSAFAGIEARENTRIYRAGSREAEWTLAAHIGLDHMEAGIALVTHYLNEALRLYEVGVQDHQLSLAQKLLGWLKARGRSVITLPEIYQLGPKPIRNAHTARLLMDILEEHGHVQGIGEASKYRGVERREAWSIGHELRL